MSSLNGDLPASVDRVEPQRGVWALQWAGRLFPLAVLAVYAVTADWRQPFFADSYGAALEAWKWATNGAPWLDDVARSDLVITGQPYPNWLFLDNGEHAVSSRTIGVVASAIPLSWLLGDTFLMWPSTLTAVLLATTAASLMHRTLVSMVGVRLGLAGAVVFAFATPTWSVSADSLVTHSLTQAAIAGAALAASRANWWWCGLALAVGTTGRVHLAAIALVLGLGVALARRNARVAVGIGFPVAVAIFVVTATNAYRFGVWSLSGGYASYADANLTSTGASAWLAYLHNWAGYLVSPDRGLLLWTPLAVVLLVPALRAVRRAPDWAVWLSVGGIAYTAIQLKINYFAGGDSFYGYRHGLELMTCITPLLALAWRQVRTGTVRRLGVVSAWLQFVLVFPGAVVTGLFVPQEYAWTWSSALVALARAPLVTVAGALAGVAGAIVSLRLLRLHETQLPGTTQDEVAER